MSLVTKNCHSHGTLQFQGEGPIDLAVNIIGMVQMGGQGQHCLLVKQVESLVTMLKAR